MLVMLKLLQLAKPKVSAPARSFSTQTFKPYQKNRDHMVRGFTKNGHVRFSFLDCSAAVRTSINNFKLKEEDLYTPLGNTFTFSLLLSSFLKGEERVKAILTYLKDNNVHTCYGESVATGEIRGFARKQPRNPEMNYQPLLSVARILYNQASEYSSILTLDENFQGSTPEMKEILHRFFLESEQIPTYGNIHFSIEDTEPKAMGYLVQSMPGCPEAYIKDVYDNVFEKKVWPLLVEKKGLDAQTVQDAFKEANLDVNLNRYPIDFYCRCKKEDFVAVLKTIDVSVVFDMKEKKENELQCMYCNKSHFLETADFDHILQEKADSQKIDSGNNQ